MRAQCEYTTHLILYFVDIFAHLSGLLIVLLVWSLQDNDFQGEQPSQNNSALIFILLWIHPGLQKSFYQTIFSSSIDHSMRTANLVSNQTYVLLYREGHLTSNFICSLTLSSLHCEPWLRLFNKKKVQVFVCLFSQIVFITVTQLSIRQHYTSNQRNYNRNRTLKGFCHCATSQRSCKLTSCWS